MSRLALALAGLVLVPSLAAARPITVGASVGLAQDAVDASSEPNQTVGVFGRLQLWPRVSGQIDVAKLDAANVGLEVRSGTALVVVDLLDHGTLMPVIFGGAGLDRAVTHWGYEAEARHFVGGVGLEYRAAGGLTLGADVRIGGRTVESDGDIVLPLARIGGDTSGTAAYVLPAQLRSGEYRAARVTLGVRF